ncbi:MAG: thiamine permease [Dehalococcoidia bacterium]|nr:thiamine permease [Dehalococcoidia bacterium]
MVMQQPSKGNVWTTREIVVTAAVCVVIGLLFVFWGQVYTLAEAATGPLGAAFANGFWMIGGVIIAYIVRRPGAALTGELLAALVSLPFSPWGWTVLISGLVQGLGAEVGFAAFRWRNYSWPVLMLAGALAALGGWVQEYLPYEYGALEVWMQVATVAFRMLGGAVLAGLLTKGIVDALAATGVLHAFPAGRQRIEEV